MRYISGGRGGNTSIEKLLGFRKREKTIPWLCKKPMFCRWLKRLSHRKSSYLDLLCWCLEKVLNKQMVLQWWVAMVESKKIALNKNHSKIQAYWYISKNAKSADDIWSSISSQSSCFCLFKNIIPNHSIDPAVLISKPRRMGSLARFLLWCPARLEVIASQ